MVLSELANAVAPFVGVIIGAVISATAVLIATAISNRAQDRRLRIELLNDESKEAIAELYRLVKEPDKASGVWSRNIRKFLNSFEGRAFLPPEVRAWALEKLQNFSNKTDEMYPEFVAEEQYQAEQEEEQEQFWIESMDDNERRDYDFDQHWKEVKREFRSYLIGAVAMLVTSKPPSFRDRFKSSLGRRRSRKPRPDKKDRHSLVVKLRRLKRRLFSL